MMDVSLTDDELAYIRACSMASRMEGHFCADEFDVSGRMDEIEQRLIWKGVLESHD